VGLPDDEAALLLARHNVGNGNHQAKRGLSRATSQLLLGSVVELHKLGSDRLAGNWIRFIAMAVNDWYMAYQLGPKRAAAAGSCFANQVRLWTRRLLASQAPAAMSSKLFRRWAIQIGLTAADSCCRLSRSSCQRLAAAGGGQIPRQLAQGGPQGPCGEGFRRPTRHHLQGSWLAWRRP